MIDHSIWPWYLALLLWRVKTTSLVRQDVQKGKKKKEDTTYWWQLVLLLHRPHTQTLQRIEQKIHSTNTVKTQQSNELPKTCKRYHW